MTQRKPGCEENIGDRIKRLTIAKGWRQRQLAKRAGVDESSLSMWINGRRTPQGEYVTRMARALGVSADFLLTGEEVTDMTAEEFDNVLGGMIERFKPPGMQAEPRVESTVGDGKKIPIVSEIEDGDPAEWLGRAGVIGHMPVSGGMGINLHENMFGIIMGGDSMAPKFSSGDWLILDPHQKFEPDLRNRVGVVKVRGGDTLVRWISSTGDGMLIIEEGKQGSERRALNVADVERIYVIAATWCTRGWS